MANSDVKAKRLTGTGAASIGRARLRQIQVLTGGGAGRLTLTDGNGGSTVLDIDFSVICFKSVTFELTIDIAVAFLFYNKLKIEAIIL